MLAALFLCIICALVALFLGRRKLTLTLWVITLGWSIILLVYHATDALKINW